MATTTTTTTAALAVGTTWTWPEDRVRQGLVFDRFPFRLDISVEYQDWILVAVSFFLVSLWTAPCVCGRMRRKCSRRISEYLYTRLHSFFWYVTYFNLAVLMFTIGVLPDWTVNEYLIYLLEFTKWVLLRLKKIIISAAICVGFLLIIKFQSKLRTAAGMDHVSLIHFNWKEFLCINVKKRPIELYLWKVEDLHATKLYKAQDLFIECHFGDNEPMRTRVHNNAGTSCEIKESFQMNMNESDTSALMTLLVKDQSMIGSTEIAKLTLSTREICSVEDATGKRRMTFRWGQEDDAFVEMSMLPHGKIFIAIAPVCEEDDEKQALLSEKREDALMTC
jgi:hypothetical protein